MLICATITLFAGWLTSGLWPDPATHALAFNPNDQALDEWFLAHGTRFYTGDFHLVTGLLNAPDGVNLMCNASLIALGILMAPVTLAFGAPVSFAVVMAANLAATGIGWYLLFTRTLRLRRLGAAVGAGFAAFAPGMVSQANGHIHITAQLLVPPIVWCVVRLARLAEDGEDSEDSRDGMRRWVRAARLGVLLGALIALQLFIGEEVLFLAALALGTFCVVFAVARPSAARRFLPTVAAGLGVAAAVAIGLLAYPLWLQFSGPQSVPNGPFNAAYFSADLAGFASISPLSYGGEQSATALSSSPAEYTGFFGWPLLLVAGGIALWLWRRPPVLAAAVTALLMCGFSLGPQLVINQVRTTHTGPYALLSWLPVLDNALPTRFALAAIAPLALMLATAIHIAVTEARLMRIIVPVAVVVALVPLLPRPLPVQHRAAAPLFFSAGHWRACVPRNGVLVPVPLPNGGDPDTMRWAAAANDEFGLPQGWFIGPYASGGGASVGIYPRPTSQLFDKIATTGQQPKITQTERDAAAADITYWGASCVVLAADHPRAAELKFAVDGLFGPGERVADVWTWHVSPRTH